MKNTIFTGAAVAIVTPMNADGSIDAFFDWYNTVKEAHEAQKPPISVGDGSIDMSEIAGTNNG